MAAAQHNIMPNGSIGTRFDHSRCGRPSFNMLIGVRVDESCAENIFKNIEAILKHSLGVDEYSVIECSADRFVRWR